MNRPAAPHRDPAAGGARRRLHAVRIALEEAARPAREARAEVPAAAAAAARRGDPPLLRHARPGRRRPRAGDASRSTRTRSPTSRAASTSATRSSCAQTRASIPWLPGEGTADRAADRVHPAGRSARGPRAESRADAPLLLPEAEEGRHRSRSSRTRSASARSAGRRPRARPRSSRTSRTRPGRRRCPCARSTRRTGDILPPTVPPGPDNPLGRHMMRLGWPSYLIHGTNKPPAVGMRASAGCVRLYPEDIALIFEAVPDGTKVTVVNQPCPARLAGRPPAACRPTSRSRTTSATGPTCRRRCGRSSRSRRRRSGRGSRSTTRRSTGRPSRRGGEAARHRVLGRPGHGRAISTATVAAAPQVRNAMPVGATWNGVEDQYAGDPHFAKPAEAETTKASSGKLRTRSGS